MPAPAAVRPDGDFGHIRSEFALPDGFAPRVIEEAEAAAARAVRELRDRADATAIPLVTIDPPGAKDLDQAVCVERRQGGGFRVHYAIADVGAFVLPGGAVDAEARSRGQTLYLPDGNVPLHPPALSEGAASLLPGQTRPAALWTIDTDSDAEPVAVHLRRALVRSVAQFDYEGVQADIGSARLHESLAALPDFGRARRELAVARGAIELQMPEQEISCEAGGTGWRLDLRLRTEVDAWNAEISLMTGMCAARMMIDARIGVLRTLPDPDEETVSWLRRSVAALGLDWPPTMGVAELLAGLDPERPESLALYADSTRLLRGAGYTAFDGEVPAATSHGGIGGPYAHVTAPIRRLVDRFGTEVCLAVGADAEVPDWAREALPELPSLMGTSDTHAAKVERACLDQVETWVLQPHVGREFEAVVLRAEESRAEVLLTDPPVLAKCSGNGLQEGRRTVIKLVDVDPVARTATFEKA